MTDGTSAIVSRTVSDGGIFYVMDCGREAIPKVVVHQRMGDDVPG